jgi:hypothetical protein
MKGANGATTFSSISAVMNCALRIEAQNHVMTNVRHMWRF